MDAFAAYAVLAVLVQKVVEHTRKAIPVDGGYVFAAASGLGILAALATDLRIIAEVLEGYDVAPWFDTILTGFGIGAGAGFFADITGRSG